ncbi:hypothetical protein EU527_03505 [Candidatus Thorarchaeota archaeon]|nr:MAG: hypothetical protein EU527_03505 [Candidatus Thorarchaeota archaeon]
MTGSIPILEEVRNESTLVEVQSDMSTIDEGTYLVLRSASGAFTCRYPPVPKKWNSIDRPHVALLLHDSDRIFPVFLSQPDPYSNNLDLETADLSKLPTRSIIEIRHNNSHFAYYRRDNGSWTKVAEANDPFIVEVFSHGYAPVVMNLIPPQ